MSVARMKSGVARAAALLTLALAGTVGAVGTAQPASASATGCSQWGQVSVGGYNLFAGQYCFTIRGSGLQIDGTLSSYNTAVMYNWGETVRFYDNNGSNYSTFTLPTRTGRYYGAQSWSLPINGGARSGRVCGEFKSSGTTLARVCHNIFA